MTHSKQKFRSGYPDINHLWIRKKMAYQTSQNNYSMETSHLLIQDKEWMKFMFRVKPFTPRKIFLKQTKELYKRITSTSKRLSNKTSDSLSSSSLCLPYLIPPLPYRAHFCLSMVIWCNTTTHCPKHYDLQINIEINLGYNWVICCTKYTGSILQTQEAKKESWDCSWTDAVYTVYSSTEAQDRNLKNFFVLQIFPLKTMVFYKVQINWLLLDNQ